MKTAKFETLDLAVGQDGEWLRYIGDLKIREISTRREPGRYGCNLRVGGKIAIGDMIYRIREIGSRIFTSGGGGSNYVWVTVSRRVDARS